MKLSRRGFLFGSAAALGVVALAPYLEPIIWQDGGYKKRAVYRIGVSSPVHDNAVMEIWVKRWPTNAEVFYVGLNARAVYSWEPDPGRELIFTDNSLMLIEATGCPSQIHIEGRDDGMWFEERYSFPGPHKERWVIGSDGSGPWMA